jgi:Fe-S oxidoreductase
MVNTDVELDNAEILSCKASQGADGYQHSCCGGGGIQDQMEEEEEGAVQTSRTLIDQVSGILFDRIPYVLKLFL